MSGNNARPGIPAAIKRSVRIKYGFGCAICGLPIFDYDHFDEYSEVQEHSEDNLVILCPNHHSDKTRKRMSKNRLQYYRDNYHNKDEQFTSSYKIEPDIALEVEAGSNRLYWSPPAEDSVFHVIWIAGESHFTLHIEDGWMSFSLHLTDSSGSTLLHVDRGEMIVSTGVEDYEFVADRLKIRGSGGCLIADITISSDKVIIHKGQFITGSMGWNVDNDFIHTVGTKGGIMSVGGTVHYTGHGGGMYGIVNPYAYQAAMVPSFGFAYNSSAIPTGYLFLSPETYDKLLEGKFHLKSLRKYWVDDPQYGELSADQADVSRHAYFIDVATNERVRAENARCFAIKDVGGFLNMLACAAVGNVSYRIQTAFYCPDKYLAETRGQEAGGFAESDAKSLERVIRLIVQMPHDLGDRLTLATDEIQKLGDALKAAGSNQPIP
jgi:hypothetical protein